MNPVDIGSMRKAIDLQVKPSIDDAETDSHGEEVEVWTTIRTIYAAIRPATARERVVGDQLRNEVSHVVETRWIQDVDPEISRLKFGARIFNIVGVINVDEMSRLARFYCLEQT